MPELLRPLIAFGEANPLFALGAVLGLGLMLSAFVRSR